MQKSPKTFSKSLILLIVLAPYIARCALSTLATFTAHFPANTFTFLHLPAPSNISFNLNWSLPLSGNSIQVKLTKIGNGTSCSSNSVSSSPATFEFSVPEAGDYSVQVSTAEYRPTPYTLQVTTAVGTTTFTDLATSYHPGKGIYQIYIPRTCTNGAISSFDSGNYQYFNFFYPSDIPSISNVDYGCFSQPSAPNISVNFNETGVYYMIPHSSISGLWVTAQSEVSFVCHQQICGDGFKQPTQSCDNGNYTGCVDCVVDPAYSCGGDTTATACQCRFNHFSYDTTNRQCLINCSSIQYATSIKPFTNNQCQCLPNYIFNQTAYECIIDCSSLPGTIGNSGSISQCLCSAGFYFDTRMLACIINCSSIAHSIGYDLQRSIDRCICQENFDFDIASLQCVINCSNMNALGPAGIDHCICAAGFQWTQQGCDSVCGDGIVTPDQECDDGNLNDNDGCSKTCTVAQMEVKEPKDKLSPVEIGLIVGIVAASLVAMAVGVLAYLSWKAKSVINQSSSHLVPETTKMVTIEPESMKNHEHIETQQH